MVEIWFNSREFQSSTLHEELCVNMRRPLRKAKYSLATDSELVLWRKGEKYRCERSEIEPETLYLQGVGAQHFLVLNKQAKIC